MKYALVAASGIVMSDRNENEKPCGRQNPTHRDQSFGQLTHQQIRR